MSTVIGAYWSPSDPGFHLVALPEKPEHKLSVKAIEGETNAYNVESETLWCRACKKHYGSKMVANRRLKEGGLCPWCQQGALERYWYTVSLADYKLHGSCDCTDFQVHRAPELKKMHPSLWLLLEQRCKHLRAAAVLHQLIYSEMLEREAHKNNKRGRNYDGP